MYHGDEYNNVTSSGLTGGLDMFEDTMGGFDLNTIFSDSRAFDLNIDLSDGNIDIIWDSEFTVADAILSDFCASQANP